MTAFPPVSPGKVTTRLALAICLLLYWDLASATADDRLTVTIEGLENRLRDNVTVYLQINELAGKPVSSEARLRWLHSQAPEDIRRALQPFGFYQPEITASLERTDSGWQARYRVNAGPPLRVTKLDVRVLGEGSRDPAFQKALTELPLAKGQVLEHARYERIKQTLQELATERGYFNAHLLANEVRVDLQTYSAAVILHFDTGQRYRFGQITFHQDALAPEFLRRYLDFQPGDPYAVADLLKLQSDLISSNYFTQVGVNASPDHAVDLSLPVDVDLQLRKSLKLTYGLGYGTDTGVRGKINIERPWINPWGHHYDVELLASQIKYGLAGKYVIPGKDPRTDSFSLRASVLRQNFSAQDNLAGIVGISQQHQDGAWLKITSLNYQLETFTIGDNQQTTGLLIPGLNWTRVVADNRLNTTDGSLLNLMLQGAYEPLLSDLSFLQATVRGKRIKSLDINDRFILRAALGTTFTSDFDQFPTSLRFYAGGDNSVRGYSLDSIGPRNAQGDVIGGKHLVVGSLEYEHRILENWSVAGFVDSGDAFDQAPEFKTGVGIGLRWLSPVGPVRVDLASGLERPPGDIIRLHLIIGPDL